jgi:hypothetical protein
LDGGIEWVRNTQHPKLLLRFEHDDQVLIYQLVGRQYVFLECYDYPFPY